MSDFLNFLKLHKFDKKKKKNQAITHLCLQPDRLKGCYSINDSDLINFYSLYAEYVYNKGDIGLLEKHQDRLYYPLFFDIDLKDDENESRLYTHDEIVNFLRAVYKCAKKFVVFTNLECYVCEHPHVDVPHKDGLHVYFDLLISQDAHELIRNDLLNEMSSCFKYFKEAEDLDPCIIRRNGLLMIGSNKPNRSSYDITTIYNIKEGAAIFCEECNLSILDKIKITSLRKEITEDPKFTDEFISANSKKILPAKTFKGKIYDDTEIYTEVHITYAKKFAYLLSKKRLSQYDTWIETAVTLYNISPNLYETFDQISRKTTRNNYDSEKVYDAFFSSNPYHNSKRKLGSLIADAKKDSPNKAGALLAQLNNDIDRKTAQCDVANMFKSMEANFSDELNRALQLGKNFQWINLNDLEDKDSFVTQLKDAFDVIAHLKGQNQTPDISEFFSSVVMANNRLECRDRNGNQIALRSDPLAKVFEMVRDINITIQTQETKDSDQIVSYMNNLHNISEYRKYNGFIYVRHPVALNYFTRHLSYRDFFNEQMAKAPSSIKENFANRSTARKEVISSIEEVNLYYRPLKVSRYIISFKNGYIDFEDIHNIKFVSYNPIVDYECGAKIFINQDFDDSLLKTKHWSQIECPFFSKLVDHNFKTIGEDVREVFYGLCGRLHFPPSYDGKQCVPYVKGPPGIGKTTIMTIILSQHSQEKTTVVNTKESTFGGQNIVDKHLLIDIDAPETMIENFCGENGKTTFQKIVDGGSNCCIPVKKGSAYEGSIEIQQFYCSNYEQKVDENGEIARRLAMFEFSKAPCNRDNNLSDKIIKYESTLILIKMLLAYRELLIKYDSKIFEDWDIKYFKEQRIERMLEQNPFMRYLESTSLIIQSSGSFIEWKDLVQDYRNVMKQTLSKSELVFDKNGRFPFRKTVPFCKACKKILHAGCCPEYNDKFRTTKNIVMNLCIREFIE